MEDNRDLLILLDVFGWSRCRVAREVGVSDVAVIKWLRGAKIREVNKQKLKEAVQRNRFYVKHRITDFYGARKKDPDLTWLRHALNCGIPLADIQDISKVSELKLQRYLKHPGEMTSDFIMKMMRVMEVYVKLHGQEKIVDLLDTEPAPAYDPVNDPVLVNDPFA